ncbi:tripartite tricarboxylate transporter substrate binding protein [Pigmentiphaga sp. YJ18]|uniref:tripartite tricarboxylate transporter substrate binding protein n=1 Tax=Pigmentiphaga sp. YJ18 TaxID=3134907 RepID=UPI00310CE338
MTKHLVKLAVLSWGLAAPLAAAHAEAFPSKPIRLVVPFAPGGGTDSVARLLSKRITERTGQPVVVETRVGAGGAIGAALVAKAPADGYTLLLTVTGPVTIIPNVNPNVGYKTSDLAPVAIAYRSPFMVMVGTDSPYQTLSQLLADGRNKQPAPSYGSSGIGALSHLVSELINQQAGTHFNHVPYKGSQDTLYAMVRGDVQWGLQSAADARSFLAAGKLRPLAVLSKERSARLPDVPTLEESGIHGVDLDLWFGLFAPAATPPATVHSLNTLVNEILAEPDIAKRLQELGGQAPADANTPEIVKQTIDREVKSFGAVARAIKLKLE